jgi:hypothetical protein
LSAVLSRTIPAPVISHYQTAILGLEPKISAFFKEEKLRLQIDQMTRFGVFMVCCYIYFSALVYVKL